MQGEGDKTVSQEQTVESAQRLTNEAPTWADDVAFMFTCESARRLVDIVRQATAIIDQTMAEFGVQMNLKAGKSEVIMAWYGTGSKKAQRHVLDEENEWICFWAFDGQEKAIYVTDHFMHLGGLNIANGNVCTDIATRFQRANKAFADFPELGSGFARQTSGLCHDCAN